MNELPFLLFPSLSSHRKFAWAEMALYKGLGSPSQGKSSFAGLAWLWETLVISLRSPGSLTSRADGWQCFPGTVLLHFWISLAIVRLAVRKPRSAGVPWEAGWEERVICSRQHLSRHANCRLQEIGWFISGFGRFSYLFSSVKFQVKILKVDVTDVNHWGLLNFTY